MIARVGVAAALALACLAGAPAWSQPTEVRTVSISASGDLLAHNTVFWRAETKSGYNFGPMLAGVANSLNADVDICHLETPLTQGEPKGYPVFATPVSLADTIKAVGWEGCSVVSNHSLDQGSKGVKTTYRALHLRGLETAGTRPTQDTSAVAWYETASGVKVAQLAYAYGFNGFKPPADQPWLVNSIKVGAILRAAAEARAAGAELVVVSLHWGVEYQDTPNSWQRQIARQLTASPDVDAIIGHHSHVLQFADIINGKPVIFGLGNLWSAQGPWAGQPNGQHGAIVRLKFTLTDTGAEFTSGTYVPTLTLHRSWKVQPAQRVTTERSEACRAIKDAAEHLGSVLSGPRYCPQS